jgi:superfamily I DNA and/or RNA helicase
VGVICLYKAQASMVASRLRAGGPGDAAMVQVSTVDAFQGKQDDIVVYSNVRANTAELRFISLKSRLNVAFSRAKRDARCVRKPSEMLVPEAFTKILSITM